MHTTPVAPSPKDVYRRAVIEGHRRLAAGPVELLATGFNAGFTIAFGVMALGIVHSLLEPQLGSEIAKLGGAVAFAIGLVFLVVSRAELFTENFFDPVATLFAERSSGMIGRLARLWMVVLACNLVGGGALIAMLSIGDAIPPAAKTALGSVAEEIVRRPPGAAFANAVVGGALVTLLSFMLQAVDTVVGRIATALMAGFLLAVGPFAHVVVTFEHLVFGALADTSVSVADIGRVTAIAVGGNLVGGLAFVTLTHIAQARGGQSSNGASGDAVG